MKIIKIVITAFLMAIFAINAKAQQLNATPEFELQTNILYTLPEYTQPHINDRECITEPFSLKDNDPMDVDDLPGSWTQWWHDAKERMLELTYKDGKLHVYTFYVNLWTHPLTFLYKSHNVLFIDAQFMDLDCSTDDVCVARLHAIYDIPEGTYTILSKYGKRTLNLRENCRYTIEFSKFPKDNWLVRKDVEWVYYNAGLNNDPTFIRMRIATQDGKNVVKYCIGDTFDYDKAETLSEIKQYGDYIRLTGLNGDSELPSILFGASPDWDNTIAVNPIALYNFSQEGDFVFIDALREVANRPEIIDITHETVDGHDALLVHYSNGLKYLEGVGPIGDDYASNLAHPATELDDNVVPTHFLYMRDITDNHIIYGDPTIDHSYYRQATIESSYSDCSWFDTANEIGFDCDKPVDLYVYDLAGNIVYHAIGSEGIRVNKHDLSNGIYIVKAICDNAMESHKIVVR